MQAGQIYVTFGSVALTSFLPSFLLSFFPSFLPALAFPFHSLPVRSSQRKTFMFDCNCKALIVEKLMGPQSPASRLFLSAAPASLPSLLCARVSKDV